VFVLLLTYNYRLAKSKLSERNLVHALRNPRSFTVTPATPTFPQPPVVEERNMQIVSKNFHMSQVDGAKKKKKTTRQKRNTSTAVSRRKWKIEPRDVTRRDLLLGVWKDVSLGGGGNTNENDCSPWPDQLRKRLLVGRTMSRATKKRSALFASGPIISMLRNFERGIEFKLPRHRSSDKAIESLFPLDGRSLDSDVLPVNEYTSRPVDRYRGDPAKANNSESTKESSVELHRKNPENIHGPLPTPPPHEHHEYQRNEYNPRAAEAQQPVNVPVTTGRQESVVNPYLKRSTTSGGSANISATTRPDVSVASTCEALPPKAAPTDRNLAPTRNPYAVRHTQVQPPSLSAPGTCHPAAPSPVVDHFNNVLGPIADHLNDVSITRESQSVLSTENVYPPLRAVGAPADEIFDEFKLPSQDDSSSDESVASQPEFKLPSQDDSSSDESVTSQPPETVAPPIHPIESNRALRKQRDDSIEATNDADDMFVLPTPDSSSDEESLGECVGREPAVASVESHQIGSALPLQQGFETDFGAARNIYRQEALEADSSQAEEFVRTKRRKVLAIEDTPASSSSVCVESQIGSDPPLHQALDTCIASAGKIAQAVDTPQTVEFVRTKRRKVLAIEDTPESRGFRDEPNPTEQLGAGKKLQKCPAAESTPDSFGFKRFGTAAINHRAAAAAASGLTNTPDDEVVEAESIVCAVCNSNTVLEEDPLILCDGMGGRCSLAVHVTCYAATITDMAATWFCDPCQYRQSNNSNNIGTIMQKIHCSSCGATSGALKRLESFDAWACVSCPPTKKMKNQLGRPRPSRLPGRRDRRPLTDVNPAVNDEEEDVDGDRDDDDDVVRKKKRREKVLAKYVVDEAEGPSDMSDDDDPDLLRAIDEEEEDDQDGFINDSSQLGYTQDELDVADPDDSHDLGQHQALDAARENMRRFDTPVLNRRVRDKKTWSCSQESERSDRGLGNMHFIRSVLEHHRQGGDVNDIEAAYQELEAEAASVGEDDDGETP
jgi:hypothetical protein